VAITDRERHALICLAELHHLVNVAGPLWPGWEIRSTPLAVYTPGGNAFLLHHPRPVAPFQAVDASELGLTSATTERIGPLYHSAVDLPFLRAATAQPLNGALTGLVPVWLDDDGPARFEAFIALLAREAFQVYGRRWSGGRPSPFPADRYPDLSPVNNALGNVEGRLLQAAWGETDPDVLRTLVRRFCLVRRERRGPLDEALIEYEQHHELHDGLPGYVELLALERGSSPDYRASAEYRRLTGNERYVHGPLLVEQTRAELGRVNLRGQGANRVRFSYTGAAIARFLDRIRPGWQAHLESARANLDRLLEEGVLYDGGDGDEREIVAVLREYGYDDLLEAERLYARQEEARKRELLDSVLRGSGIRISIDVSHLVGTEDWWDRRRGTSLWWDPAHVEKITEHIRVHTRMLTFKSRGTILSFEGLPVVEDRRNKIFHSCLPDGRLNFVGDSQPFSIDRPAEFSEGLEIRCPGLEIQAEAGYLQNADGVLYIKIFQ